MSFTDEAFSLAAWGKERVTKELYVCLCTKNLSWFFLSRYGKNVTGMSRSLSKLISPTVLGWLIATDLTH